MVAKALAAQRRPSSYGRSIPNKSHRQLNKFKIQISVIFEEKPSNSAMFSTQAENIFRGKRTTLWPTLALPTSVYRPPGIQGLFASEM